MCVSLCTAESALRTFGMTYMPLHYVVRPNISHYANMLIRTSLENALYMLHRVLILRMRSRFLETL
jgi:hypothetical protein